jgi:hypothetical protein
LGRISVDLPAEKVISFWGGLNFSVFSQDMSMVQVIDFAGTPPFRQEVWRQSGALQLGIQFGLPGGIIRPRAAAGLSYYFFFTQTELTDVNSSPISGENRPSRRFDDIQGRPGWRGIVGLDIIVSSKWGISLDFIHDTVWRFGSASGSESRSATSRFMGFSAGVVIPFESFKKHVKGDEWEPKDPTIDRQKGDKY